MSHLGERITDYVFEELSSAAMAEARDHVAHCGECTKAVEHFQRTRSLLQALPDVDPPRSAQLVFEKPRATRWAWRWLAPIGVAAALVLAVVLAGPVHMEWQQSQLTIALGNTPVAKPSVIELQNASAIKELNDHVSYLERLNEKQQQELYQYAAYVQVLAQQQGPRVGD
jgi:anti-sigma factor RsiW